jgi:lipopolysaccharide transport protein LptA
MAASSPDSGLPRTTPAWRPAAAILALLAASAVAAQQQQEITLEAASSDFDRRGEQLLFRDIRIQQGDLVISAAEAETRELEFSDGSWEFRGAVRIEGAMGIIEADRATISFQAHRLSMAVAEGAPARFARTLAGPEPRRVTGTANRIQYDPGAGEMSLQGQAMLRDGTREASGARLLYRIAEERLIASGDEEGGERVRIVITPPDKEDDEDTPPEQGPNP